METLACAVRLEPVKEGGYVVTCRDLPETVRPLSPTRGTHGQPQQDRGGHRARARWLCVGHCAARQAHLIDATINAERRQRTISLDPSAR